MKRTVLGPLHEARGAQWMEYHGWEIPACYSGLRDEYETLTEGTGIVDFSYRGKLRITGRDRRTWLHGQVTQEINNLPEWRGAYAAVLTPQGRMVSDMRVWMLPDAILIDVPPALPTPMHEYLDRFLIMERAEIEDVTDAFALLSLQGPEAACALAAVFGEDVIDLPAWGIQPERFRDQEAYVTRVGHCGEDGYDVFVPAEKAAALWGVLCQHRRQFAVNSVGWQALNVRRTEAGIPRWGAELDSSIVPVEARLDHAISYSKGCYVGQEIIARIDARGHVNNLLAGFFLPGETALESGTEIHHEGRKVGRITTALRSEALGRLIGLGYLRRELQEPGTRVQAVTPTGPVEIEVAARPFVPCGGSAPCDIDKVDEAEETGA